MSSIVERNHMLPPADCKSEVAERIATALESACAESRIWDAQNFVSVSVEAKAEEDTKLDQYQASYATHGERHTQEFVALSVEAKVEEDTKLDQYQTSYATRGEYHAYNHNLGHHSQEPETALSSSLGAGLSPGNLHSLAAEGDVKERDDLECGNESELVQAEEVDSEAPPTSTRPTRAKAPKLAPKLPALATPKRIDKPAVPGSTTTRSGRVSIKPRAWWATKPTLGSSFQPKHGESATPSTAVAGGSKSSSSLQEQGTNVRNGMLTRSRRGSATMYELVVRRKKPEMRPVALRQTPSLQKSADVSKPSEPSRKKQQGLVLQAHKGRTHTTDLPAVGSAQSCSTRRAIQRENTSMVHQTSRNATSKGPAGAKTCKRKIAYPIVAKASKRPRTDGATQNLKNTTGEKHSLDEGEGQPVTRPKRAKLGDRAISEAVAQGASVGKSTAADQDSAMENRRQALRKVQLAPSPIETPDELQTAVLEQPTPLPITSAALGRKAKSGATERKVKGRRISASRKRAAHGSEDQSTMLMDAEKTKCTVNDKSSKPAGVKEAVVSSSQKESSKITSGVGTLARTRQMREALVKRNEGHEDDLFESAEFALPGTQGPDVVNTPKDHLHLRAALFSPSSGRSAGSPEILKPFDVKAKEAYVHVLKQRRILAARKEKETKSQRGGREVAKKVPARDKDLAGALAGRRPELFRRGFDDISDDEDMDGSVIMGVSDESE